MPLRPIERTDRAKRRLEAALSIYRETILPEARNPERQILYWIDHSRTDLADEFRCFAIEEAGKVVGYLQYSYFREEHVFFFEYLCIRRASSRGLVSSGAIHEIEQYLATNYAPGFTIVFEVAHQRDSRGAWRPDTRLTRYFSRLSFRVVEFQYRYPVLQSYDGAIAYPASLLVRLPDDRTVVSAPEMRTLLRCIYFRHYLRWDRPFLLPERLAERERLINSLYSEQVAEVDKKDNYPTTGDDSRPVKRFSSVTPRIRDAMAQILGPRLPRLLLVIGVLVGVSRILESVWLLIPLVLCASAAYCLAENTAASRRLFVIILDRLRFERQS